MLRSVAWLLVGSCASACLVPGLEVGSEPAPSGGASGSGGMSFLMSGASGGPARGGEFAGGAGPASVWRCEDRPIPPKSEWQVAASSSSLGSGQENDPLYNPPGHVVDGSLEERWASGLPQESEGQWFHVDFGREVVVSEVTLQQGQSLKDFPRGYAISISDRHTDFDARARALGHGAPVSEQVIPLGEKAVGRYLMIRQTGTADTWWSIAELHVACHE